MTARAVGDVTGDVGRGPLGGEESVATVPAETVQPGPARARTVDKGAAKDKNVAKGHAGDGMTEAMLAVTRGPVHHPFLCRRSK